MTVRYTVIKPISGLLLALALFWGARPGAEAIFQSPTVTPTPTATATGGPPELFADALCGRVGDDVSVTGDNFSPNQLIAVTWSGFGLATIPETVQADPAGRLRFSFVVPNDEAGPHLVQASDGLQMAQFSFTLGAACATPTPTETAVPTATPTPTQTPTPTADVPQPALTCDPAAARPDETIYVHGEDFHPGGHFDQLRWDGVIIPWAPAGLTVGDDGRFDLWFNAPSDTFELHTLVADDGKGGRAECYIDLMPPDPTPTWTPTPTLTPTPTATWTPGPPPRMTVTPTLTPAPEEYCAAIAAVFRPEPALSGAQIEAGIELTNLNRAWGDNQLQLGMWQYSGLAESDTGVRLPLPALAAGETLTLRHRFPAPPDAGPVWFQLRLIEQGSGALSNCTSPWFGLPVIDNAPDAPPLIEPPDGVWLDRRELTLDWLPPAVPDGAGPVEEYEVQVIEVDGEALLFERTGQAITTWPYEFAADYGARQLAWRARARNSGGWGRWATAFYFGVDTIRPAVDIAVSGTAGTNEWWVSPLTVRIGGSDPGPGSGLVATYLQAGDVRWEQVIPGAANRVEREGAYALRAYGRDRALNRSPVRVEPVKVDLAPPWQVGARFLTEASAAGWYTAPVTIALSAEDAVSGVAEVRGRVDDGPWQVSQVAVATEGIHTVEFVAQDRAGHETTMRQTTAKLDLTPPAGALALNGSLCQNCAPVTVSVAAGDGASGLAHWVLSLDSSGNHTVLASGRDPAREVPLDGGQLAAGEILLRLAVQDVAGWLTVQEMTVTNGGAEAGPTPTPWLMATATPWPSPTPGVMPYATISPTPGSRSGGNGDGGNSGNGGNDNNGGSEGDDGAPATPAGYPVGGTVVPAILPVTGRPAISPWAWLGLIGAIAAVAGWLAAANSDQDRSEKL